jgi:hypothetical protein
MKIRESCEAALRLCHSGDKLGVIKQIDLPPNIAFVWTAILFHIQEILESSLGQGVGKLKLLFTWA